MLRTVLRVVVLEVDPVGIVAHQVSDVPDDAAAPAS